MGMFDDLIPEGQGTKTTTGLFDDLIPEARPAAEPSRAPMGIDDRRAARGFGRSQDETWFGDVKSRTGAILDGPAAQRIRGFRDSAAAAVRDNRPAPSGADSGVDVRAGQIADIEARLADPDISDKERAFREQQLSDLKYGQSMTTNTDAPTLDPHPPIVQPPLSDLGKRAARGLTEVGAALPEAAAIAGAGNPNAAAQMAAETVHQARLQMGEAKRRLADNPDMSDEQRQRIEAVIAESQRTIDAYQPLVDISKGPLDTAPKDRPLYQRGDQIRQASQELFGTPDPQFDERFRSKLAEGAGNMAGFVGVTLTTGVLGGATAGSALNTSGMYRRALDEGATEEEARTAAYIASIVGASEVIPIARAFDYLPAPMRKKATTALARRMTNAFATAGEEGVQEAAVEIANNLTAQQIYNPDQKIITPEVGESALIGAILGGGIGAMAPAGSGARPAAGTGAPRQPEPPRLPPLTPAEQASPVPSDVIQRGKARIEEIKAKSSITQPEAPQNIPEGAEPLSTFYDEAPAAQDAPTRPVEVPERDTAPATQQEDPKRPVAATEAPESPDAPEGFEDIPEIDADGNETGRMIRIDYATGKAQVVKPEAESPARPQVDETPAEKPAAPAAPEAPVVPAVEETGAVDSKTDAPPQKLAPASQPVEKNDMGNPISQPEASEGGDLDGGQEVRQGRQEAVTPEPGQDAPATAEAIDAAAAQAAPAPTEAQKEAGNFQKGHTRWNGLDISIENAKGSTRRGKDGDGKAWSVEMPAHYGYVRRTEGADGDHVDVYVGDNPDSDRVFVVDQMDAETGAWDEHKAMIGFDSPEAAQAAHAAAFSDGKGKARQGGVTEMSAAEFKEWAQNGDTTKPLAAAPEAPATTSRDQTVAQRHWAGRVNAERARLMQAADVSGVDPATRWEDLDEGTRARVSEAMPARLFDGRKPEDAAKDAPAAPEPATDANTKKPAPTKADRIDDVDMLPLKRRQEINREFGGRGTWDGASAEGRQRMIEAAGWTDEAASEGRSIAKKKWYQLDGKTKARIVEASRSDQEAAPKEARTSEEKPAAKSKPDQETKATRIEDFGEKIEGAQKDKAKGWLARAAEVSSDEIASVPLSKSWPEPDYQGLLDEGADPFAVAFIHAARDEIPNKPRQAWKVKRWAEQVQTLREFSTGLLEGRYSKDEVQGAAGKGLKGFMGRVDLYQRFGHDKSLKGVSMVQGSFSVFEGERFERPVDKWTVQVGRRMVAHGDTTDQAMDAFAEHYEAMGGGSKRGEGVKFEIRKYRGGPIFIGKKIGRNWIEVATDPEWDWKDARKHLAENQEALEAEYARKKQLPPERGEDNSPRVGQDYRNGQDVTPEMFSEAFGFRGVQFGNYVEGSRRQQDLNEAYDGFMDLAGIIGVPPKALSLNGTLGLAFGARGSGRKASAHYEPGQIVINLTKGSGAGSLAHEWWHGMDHYFARQGGRSATLLTENPRGLSDGIRPEVVEAFQGVISAIRSSDMIKRARVADMRKSKPYFATMVEMTARGFESYVIGKLQDQSASNDYLANILSEDAWTALENMAGQTAPSWPYVRASELPEFRQAFDNLFDTIETEETAEGTVRMYQRPLDMFYSPLLRALEGAKQKQAPAKDWKAIIGKLPGVKKAEVEWLGIEEWLDAQEGQVSREAIADFVRESQIEVVEDVQESGLRTDYRLVQEGGRWIGRDDNGIGPDVDIRYEEDRDLWIIDPDGEAVDMDSRYAIPDALNGSSIGANEPQFESYTEPGGENYREVLLRVPNLHTSGKNRPPVTPEDERKIADLNRQIAELKAARNTEPGSPGGMELAGLEDQVWAIEKPYADQRKSPFVQSAHFEQENIVVHARVKDRTGPNGEKVLFVEEIQSDLASKWREATESPEVTARREEVRAEVQRRRALEDEPRAKLQSAQKAFFKRLTELLNTDPEWRESAGVSEAVGASQRTVSELLPDVIFNRLMAGRDVGPEYGTSATALAAKEFMSSDSELRNATADVRLARMQLTEARDHVQAANDELLALGTERSVDPSLPDTPFKEELTYTLMVKRLLRMAADGGYDRISWTPGYMQAERWNKAAQSVVEGVDWYDVPSDGPHRGYKNVDLTMVGGDRMFAFIDPSTGAITNGSRGLVGKQLSELIGPSLARQVLTEKSGSVSGQKITFPDSGYAIAYDQQTKRAVDKLAKKHGASVRVDKTLPDFQTDDERQQFRNWLGQFDEAEIDSRIRGVFDPKDYEYGQWQALVEHQRRMDATPSEAARYVTAFEAGAAGRRAFPEFKPEASPVWSVDITDSLRAAAMEPMSLLRRPGPPDPAKIEAVTTDLQDRLKKLMIRGVDLRADPDMAEQGALEIGRDGQMAILIGASMNKMATVNHEAIHILRARGLFTDKEWQALEAEAKAIWMVKYDIRSRYGDLDEAGQIEEAIAEAFAEYADKKAPTTRVQAAFAKIKRFFRALKEALTGQGITRPDDIFLDVESGAVGAREGRTAAPGRKEQRPSSKVRQRSPQGQQALAASTHSTTIPDRAAWDALAARNISVLDRAAGLRGSVSDSFDKFRIKVQDRMLPILRAEQAVEKLTGTKIDEKDSPYQAEERYTSKVGARLDKIDDQYTKPIIGLIAGAKTPIKIKDQNGEVREGSDAVSLWLMARHAKERNAHIASINDQMPDGGSGLTNAQADAILQQAGPHQQRLDSIGALTDQLGQDMIDLREQSGLLSPQEALAWRKMYKHYVPLRRFAENDMYDAIVNEGGTNMGRRYNVRGSESRQALGRSTEAFDPLATLLTQAQEVAIRAEKNVVAQVLHNFVSNNPNPAMWEISTPETQRYFNKATGKVETRVVGANARQLSENEMALKIKGKEHRITLNDPRIARAMGQIGTNELNGAIKFAGKFSQLFSAVNTMLSPPFVIVNGVRDMITAQVNLGESGGDIRGKLRTKAITSWVKAARGAHRGMRGKSDTEYSKWFREYEEAGGKVHFWFIEDPEGMSTDFKKRVKREARGKILGTASKLVLPSTRDNPALAWIERINLTVDNAVRLATYVEARKNGWSKEKAAKLSKNLTVNFNRRGESTGWMNALYPFMNAAIQGSQVMLKAMTARQVQGVVGGMFLFGLANDLLNAALSAEDDDGELEYDQLPNYVSERNIILATPGSEKTFATVPLPYGYNAFFYAGQQMGKIVRRVKKPGEASGQVMKVIIEGFAPVGGNSLFQAASPMLGDIAFELATNEDWLGRPIRPENPYGDYGPQSYKEYNASTPSRAIARGMNSLTGGTPIEPGLIDISPEYIDHLAKHFTGGMGRFAGQVYNIGERAAEGTLGDTEAYQIPLLRVLRTESGDFMNQTRYFEFRQAVQESRAQKKLSEATGEPMTEDMKTLNGLWPRLREAEKRRNDLGDKMDAIYADDRLSNAQREAKLKPLRDLRNKAYLDFNRAFIGAMGPQAE